MLEGSDKIHLLNIKVHFTPSQLSITTAYFAHHPLLPTATVFIHGFSLFLSCFFYEISIPVFQFLILHFLKRRPISIPQRWTKAETVTDNKIFLYPDSFLLSPPIHTCLSSHNCPSSLIYLTALTDDDGGGGSSSGGGGGVPRKIDPHSSYLNHQPPPPATLLQHKPTPLPDTSLFFLLQDSLSFSTHKPSLLPPHPILGLLYSRSLLSF